MSGTRFLVTGGAGFIGSNFIRYLLAADTAALVTNVDALTYAGVRATVDEIDADDRHTFVQGDIRDGALLDEVVPGHDVIVHFAAESHVDRSITGPQVFLETNVVGTGVLLDAARRHEVPRFLHMSTDEVYGSISEGAAAEDAPFDPSSPYSASKAGADLLVSSYGTTFGYEAIIARCTNAFGPYQSPEKLIPLFATQLLGGGTVPLYGDGQNERDWLFVTDTCAALLLLAKSGEPGGVYNVGADRPVPNLEITRALLSLTGRDESAIEWVADRPGHDRRYSVDSTKIRAMGWSPQRSLEEALAETVQWYQEREDWWQPLKERYR